MTNVLRVKNEIVDVECSKVTMKVFVLFAVSSLFLNVVLFIKEGVCF